MPRQRGDGGVQDVRIFAFSCSPQLSLAPDRRARPASRWSIGTYLASCLPDEQEGRRKSSPDWNSSGMYEPLVLDNSSYQPSVRKTPRFGWLGIGASVNSGPKCGVTGHLA